MPPKRPPLRSHAHGPATEDERYNGFRFWNVRECVERYGSLEAATERWAELSRNGELWNWSPLIRPECWWATTPRVPKALRPVEQLPAATGFLRILAPDVAEKRRVWLIAKGHASPEEIAQADSPYAHLREEDR